MQLISPTLATKTSQAWQQSLETAVAKVNSTNKPDVNSPQQLNELPIFAVIIVVNHQAIYKTQTTDGLDNTVNNTVSNNVSSAIHTCMQNWITQQSNTPANWQIVDVDDYTETTHLQDTALTNATKTNTKDGEATHKSTHETDDRISPVNVYRYVLCPNSEEMLQAHNISEEKRTAIAHVLDDQITTHLRHHLYENINTANQTATDIAGGFDCHILPVAHLLNVHKLACFDMDSTLIEQEVIVELAKATGIGDKVNEITESAMRGEIDFNESFAKRVGLLANTSTDVLDDIKHKLVLSSGAKTTIATLNALGYYTVLISGGFTYFAKHVADTLTLAEFHANPLITDSGVVTGEVELPILNGSRKAELVGQIAERINVPLAQTICIGDGANDLAMMALANLGFAYHAKPIVQSRADAAINCTGLEGVLYALGYPALSSAQQSSI